MNQHHNLCSLLTYPMHHKYVQSLVQLWHASNVSSFMAIRMVLVTLNCRPSVLKHIMDP